ncbi:hypothetical protein C1878_12730 [Gordonibacter sp. 28C]|uniref:leucine-rich repeat protein n=1 Tax=Gordonibacter sp. 28C TaxID=2078569 RepID=UPI000DF7E9F2|nr:leucine-rich repeat protein [Gordonibacter sp. 28C]RDB60905.1 hypothetical protein C1878_12730 [Gordonibacter sp. 28C]
MLARQRTIDKRQTRFKLESALMALALALGMCFTAGRAYASPTADNNWEGASYYQGFQGASTYVPDNAGRAAYETYGIWMDEPANDGTFIDDVIVTDTSKYVAETVDLSALDSGLTGDVLWKAVNKSPAYYYNIITRPYDATGPIAFQWERQGPGGNNGAYSGMGAYVKIYSSLDENGLGKDLVAPCVENQFQYNKDFAQHYSNWVTGFRWTLPANALEAGKTYYLVFEQGSTMGNGGTLGRSLSANIVFEFTTDTSQQAISYPEGQDIVTPYYAKQGGSAIVDLTEPSPRHIATNLTVSRNTKSFCNDIASYVDAAKPKFTFVLSGSNSQQFSETMAKQVAYPNIHIYDADGVGVGSDAVSLDPGKIVASWSDDDQSDMDFVFTDKIAPTYLTVKDGVLESGKDYYLVFESTCGVSTNSKLEKPVLFRFTTGDVADTSALDSALEEANGDLDATKVSVDGTDVPLGSKWVAPEAYEAFKAAVAAAQEVRDSLNPTQSAIDGALSALADAQAVFTAVQQDGTYLDTAQLASSLEAANAAKDGVAASADGADVSRGTYWVTADALSALQSAIDAAQAVLDNENATQDEVDAAVAPLEGATSAFNAAKAYGSKAREAGETFSFTDEIGTWTCRIDNVEAGEAAITAMSRPSQAGKDVAIPSSVTSGPDTFTVTALGDGARMSGGQAASKILTACNTLTIPSTVKAVNGYAFYALKANQLIFPDDSQLESIGDYGFSRLCTSNSMDVIAFPAALKSIGDYAFDRLDYCKKLDFSRCSQLDSIGRSAFSSQGPNANTGVLINSLEEIDLSGCSSLTTLGNYAFAYASVPELDLTPCSSLETIGDAAFDGMQNCTKVTLPANVTELVDDPFQYGKVLETVDFTKCTKLTEFSGFNDCQQLKNILLHDGVETVSFSSTRSFFVASGFPNAALEGIDLPASVKTASFTGCLNLTLDGLRFASPEKVESLKVGGSTVLTSVDLSKFASLAHFEFSNCTALAEAKGIPLAATNWENAFNGCSSLAEAPVVFDGVTNLNGAFAGCASLTEAPALPESVTSLERTFSDCPGIKVAPKIPSGVTSLSSTFARTGIAEAPVIPDSVANMYSAFDGCVSLAKAPKIPENVTQLSCAFSRTAIVDPPTIPSSVTSMYATFEGCASLVTAPLLPAGLDNVDAAFKDCPSLTSLPQGFVLPASDWGYWETFSVGDPYSPDNPLETFVTGPVDESIANYDWAGDNRKLTAVDPVAVESVTLDQVELSLAPGQTVTLHAQVAPDDAFDKEVVWESSDSEVATVDDEGAVVAVDGGEALVTATAGGVTAGCRVVVAADTTALESALAAARAAIEGVAVSADGTDVPSNKTWITAAAMDALKAALADGEGVAAQPHPTKDAVDSAVQAIADAKAAFKPAAGTKAVDGDVSDLAASAAAAKAAREGVASSADGTNVESTKTWVSANVAQTLDDAVAVAEALAKQENPDQVEVDAAAKALADAMAAFKPAAGTMAASASVAALGSAVASAAEAADGVVVSADGSDVTSDKTWVTESAKDALEKALADAKVLAEQDKPSQADVDAAAKALADAKAAFRPVAGLKASQAAISGLTGAADEAEAARKGVAIDTDAANVDKGASWVTQDVADALDAAIAAARTVAADPDTTQAEADAASLQLNKALAAFDAAKQAGTKGSGSGAVTDPGKGGAGSGGTVGGGTSPASQGGAGAPLVKTGDPVQLLSIAGTAAGALAALCMARFLMYRKRD